MLETVFSDVLSVHSRNCSLEVCHDEGKMQQKKTKRKLLVKNTAQSDVKVWNCSPQLFLTCFVHITIDQSPKKEEEIDKR